MGLLSNNPLELSVRSHQCRLLMNKPAPKIIHPHTPMAPERTNGMSYHALAEINQPEKKILMLSRGVMSRPTCMVTSSTKHV